MAKILIVDDEPRIRELIREHLQYAGYVCEEAGDGSAALSLLSGGGFDLVILDVMMPFMDGMTCLREMRARHINTPVIILTARGEEYDKLAGLEGGADDYVVKPFSPRELVARVKAVLARTMPKPVENSGVFTFGDLVIDTASCGNRSGIDHKRQIQFFFEFTESLNLLDLQFQGTESPVCLSILQIETHRTGGKQSARVFLDLHRVFRVTSLKID